MKGTILIAAVIGISWVGGREPAPYDPGELYLSLMASKTGWDVPGVGSSPGHAFMCIEYHLSSGIKEDCFGFYSGSSIQVVGPGVTSNELAGSRSDRFQSVGVTVKAKITEAQSRSIIKAANDFNGRGYVIVVSDCITFAETAASIAGLITPNRSADMTPTTWITQLKALN